MQDNRHFPSIIKGSHFHLVGIKGTGVAALAELLASRGGIVTGSDVADVFYTDEILKRLGITPLAFSAENITDEVECVVHSSAYNNETNPDLMEAYRRGVPVFLYTEALGAISEKAYSVGICGVHGKTSTTALAGTILSRLPLSAEALAGSVITSFAPTGGASCVMTNGNVEASKRHYFVAETCEYQHHFMSFHPQKVVLTSVDSDHQDCYPTYNDILDAFVDYLCLLPIGGEVIYCADDKGAVEAVEMAQAKRGDLVLTPYGFSADGGYHITQGEIGDGVQYFTLECMKRSATRQLALHISGKHEVLDAAAAVAVARALLAADGKVCSDYDEAICEGVAAFAGGKRRSEVVGRCMIGGNDTIFIDDYGHHPTAIRTTLAGYRDFYAGRRIVVDFMSHTYTRTAALLEDFASAFSDADDVIINKIYASAREDAESAPVTGEILSKHTAQHHKHVVYAAEFDEAAQVARRILSEPLSPDYPNGCLFVTMGAGDNWKVGQKVLGAGE